MYNFSKFDKDLEHFTVLFCKKNHKQNSSSITIFKSKGYVVVGLFPGKKCKMLLL